MDDHDDCWRPRDVLVVLIVGFIIGWLLGIWTPDDWLGKQVF